MSAQYFSDKLYKNFAHKKLVRYMFKQNSNFKELTLDRSYVRYKRTKL